MMTLNASALKVDKSVVKENVMHKPLINYMLWKSILWMMTMNVFALKANKLVVEEIVIHKPLINHMIYTLNDDIECLCSES